MPSFGLKKKVSVPERIKARSRPMQEHQLGVVDQRLGQANAPLHACGDLAHRPHPFLAQFFNYTPPPEIYTLSLHDALPIFLAPFESTRAPPSLCPSGSAQVPYL